MPIDPTTGEWTYGTQPQVGPGNNGPLGGLLQIMNVMKGQGLADRSAAQRKLADLQEVQKAGLGGTDYTTPEGQSALQGLGISPETAQTQVQNAPAMKVRQVLGTYQQAHPDEQIPSQIIEQAYLGAGLPAPAGLYGYMGREASQSGAMDRAMQKELGLSYKNALSSALTDREARTVAAQQLSASHPELATKFRDWVAMGSDEPTPYAKARKEKAEAQTGEIGAKAGLEKAHADFYNQIAGPTAAARWASVGLQNAHTTAVQTLDQLNQMRAANGGVLPGAQNQKEEEEIGKNERLLAELSAPSTTKGTADPALYQQAVSALKASLDRVKAGATASGEKPYGSLPGEFKTPAEVRGAYDSGALSREEAQQILNEHFGVPLPKGQ